MNAIATVTWQTLTGKPCCQVDAGCIGVAIVSKAAEIGTWKYTQIHALNFVNNDNSYDHIICNQLDYFNVY